MKAITLKTFERVHSWTGLLSGLALFMAFYAGALTMFHEQTEHWQAPHAVPSTAQAWSEADQLLERVTTQYPEARKEVGLTVPHDGANEVMAWWFDGEKWQDRTLEQMSSESGVGGAPETGSDERVQPAQLSEGNDLAHFVYALHYSLGIPEVGLYLMGVVSIIYGLALVTGVVLYVPSLARGLFALAPGRNLKRLWQDAHNIIGVLSLPFHVMFAITGAIFCLSAIVIAFFNVLVFRGDLIEAVPRTTGMSGAVVAKGVPAAAVLTPQEVAERAREAVRSRGGAPFTTEYVRYKQYGDEAALVEALGNSGGAMASYGGVAMSAVTGDVLNVQAAGARDANHAAYAALFGLHFGHYGALTLRWVYFVLGLAGAFLFYSGNLLWIESRRNRRGTNQTTGSLVMARITIGVCIGTCIGVSATFLATLIAGSFGIKSNGIVAPIFSVVLLASTGWAFLRAPVRAASDLLRAAAIATASVPMMEVILVFAGLRPSFFAPGSVSPGVAVVALALAAGFALLARATTVRAALGDPNSVWAASFRARTQAEPTAAT